MTPSHMQLNCKEQLLVLKWQISRTMKTCIEKGDFCGFESILNDVTLTNMVFCDIESSMQILECILHHKRENFLNKIGVLVNFPNAIHGSNEMYFNDHYWPKTMCLTKWSTNTLDYEIINIVLKSPFGIFASSDSYEYPIKCNRVDLVHLLRSHHVAFKPYLNEYAARCSAYDVVKYLHENSILDPTTVIDAALDSIEDTNLQTISYLLPFVSLEWKPKPHHLFPMNKMLLLMQHKWTYHRHTCIHLMYLYNNEFYNMDSLKRHPLYDVFNTLYRSNMIDFQLLCETACESGSYLPILEYIFEKNHDIDMRKSLQIAYKYSNLSTLKFLQEKGVNVRCDVSMPLDQLYLRAINDPELVKWYLMYVIRDLRNPATLYIHHKLVKLQRRWLRNAYSPKTGALYTLAKSRFHSNLCSTMI